jgi:hypothetical protein
MRNAEIEQQYDREMEIIFAKCKANTLPLHQSEAIDKALAAHLLRIKSQEDQLDAEARAKNLTYVEAKDLFDRAADVMTADVVAKLRSILNEGQ